MKYETPVLEIIKVKEISVIITSEWGMPFDLEENEIGVHGE